MDRVDPEASAGTIEYAGEQSAGTRDGLPVAWRADRLKPPSRSNRSVSGKRTHSASVEFMRAAISVAPALVKVRHRICEGSTPDSSSKRSTRDERTCVLPVPAEAESQTLSRGPTAFIWLP